MAAQLPGSALFAGRFRENAARALLLPRRRPGQRTPLWQQRQRSSNLLQVAGRYSDFPILAETYRECLADVFDIPALKEVLEGIRTRGIRVVAVDTVRASPFSGSLLFEYVGQSLYDGDARWPSAGHRRCCSIASCWPTCWAPKTCVSCSRRT